MPNKNDSKPYQWPSGKEEMCYKSRVDQMPNGTYLRCYEQKLLTGQVKFLLDKISDGKKKK